MADFSLALEAAEFAANAHQNHKRKNGKTPYINHLIETAALVSKIFPGEPEIIAAAFLHDVVEDQLASLDEIAGLVGNKTASLVRELTDPPDLDETTRRTWQVLHASELSYPARVIKLADKISNIREFLQSPPENWSIKQRLDYFDWAQAVLSRLSGTSQELEEILQREIEKARKACI